MNLANWANANYYGDVYFTPFLHMMKNLFKNEYAFGATVIRYAFAILFILVAVKKFRMGYGGFAESLVSPTDVTHMSREIPAVLLYVYGYIIPAAELITGVLLLVNRYVREAYTGIALIYLSFIFGQMYNGNTSKIGTEYMPSIMAMCWGVFCYERAKK